ncbi:MAG: GGDEF domain-containing protein [Bdellovibrionota bacterium]
MSLQSIPLILGVVAFASFCAAAILYSILRGTQSLGAWVKRRARTAAAASAPKATFMESISLKAALKAKRRGRVSDAKTGHVDSALMKILDTEIEKSEETTATGSRDIVLPPPPTGRRSANGPSANADRSAGGGTALEAFVVQMYESYLTEIAAFQKQLSESTSVGEILNRSCRALSGFSRKARVVYLEYQAPQRALMVGSRSSPEIFAGTQPKMFLPLQGAGKSIAAEELRSVFSNLPKDGELQRLLRDSCLIESRSQEIDQDRVWAAQAVWRVYPFYVRGIPQGAFALQENSVCQRREFNNLVDIFITQAASAVENIRLHSKMVDVSAKDAVTGLQSRKVFQERLQENFLIARRLRHPLTVVRIDIDHMPAYVKQYGSTVSEAILRHVTRHLDRHFRKSDVVARYGQDGFAILMPHTALVDALKKVEEVVRSVRESSLKLGRQEQAIEIKASVSAGVSEFPSHADNPADLLRFANEALFRSQGGSRAGVTLAKVPTGYVPPFNSRFVRSAPKALQDTVASSILDP